MIFELGNRDFDDSLLQRIAQISYENDVEDIPSPPDVSHYLVSEVSGDSYLHSKLLASSSFSFQCRTTPRV